MQRFYSFILTAAVFFAVSAVATAQTPEQDVPMPICGYSWDLEFDYDAAIERTRKNNPELYARMVAAEKLREQAARTGYSEDIVLPFFMADREDPENDFNEIYAALKYQGDSILIWVDVADTAWMKQSTIDALGAGLEQQSKETAHTRDANTGLVYNDVAIFGRPPVNVFDPNYYSSFLLTDIKEGQLTGGILSGYFSPHDQRQAPGSNNQNILYIDTKPSLQFQSASQIENVLGTLAHEFQHLINHARYQGSRGETQWIYNEGLSEVASLRSGYRDRNNSSYLQNPNVKLFEAPFGETNGTVILRAYQRSMTLVTYLWEQFGDEFLYHLVEIGEPNGAEKLRIAMERVSAGSNWQQVLRGYNVANYVQTRDIESDDIYRYRTSLGGQAGTNSAQVPDAGQTITGGFDLEAYGASYVSLFQPDPFGITFTSERAGYGVNAIIFHRDGRVEVRDVGNGEEFVWLQDPRQVIFAVSSLAGDRQKINWSLRGIQVGVERHASAPERMAILGTTPNPTSDDASITFSLAQSSEIRLELFDVSGEVRAIPVEGRYYEAGEHTLRFDASDFRSGVYLARITDATGESASSMIVIAR